MDTAAQPDDPNDGKSASPETPAAPAPSRRVFYTTTALTIPLMMLYAWYVFWLWDDGSYIVGRSRFVSIAILGIVTPVFCKIGWKYPCFLQIEKNMGKPKKTAPDNPGRSRSNGEQPDNPGVSRTMYARNCQQTTEGEIGHSRTFAVDREEKG